MTRDPSIDELQEWIEASGNRIRLVTLAPERKGSVDYIHHLTQRGIVPAIGHTAATGDEIHAAVAAGARFSTHLGNGLANQVHRHDNPIWPQLAEDKLIAGIIGDKHHLPASVLKSFVRAKGPGRIIMVSDAASPGGSPAGTYEWSGIEVEVSDEGRIGLAGTPYLAGAGHLLDRGIKTLVDRAEVSIVDAVRAVTENPHRLLCDSESDWSLCPGGRASLVTFHLRPGDSEVDIEAVMIDGELL